MRGKLSFSLARALTEVLDHFKWRRIATLYADDGQRRKCHYVHQALKYIIATKSSDVLEALSVKAKGHRITDEEIHHFLNKLPRSARSKNSLTVLALRDMHLGMDMVMDMHIGKGMGMHIR